VLEEAQIHLAEALDAYSNECQDLREPMLPLNDLLKGSTEQVSVGGGAKLCEDKIEQGFA